MKRAILLLTLISACETPAEPTFDGTYKLISVRGELLPIHVSPIESNVVVWHGAWLTIFNRTAVYQDSVLQYNGRYRYNRSEVIHFQYVTKGNRLELLHQEGIATQHMTFTRTGDHLDRLSFDGKLFNEVWK